jgi:hypothetical protein
VRARAGEQGEYESGASHAPSIARGSPSLK